MSDIEGGSSKVQALHALEQIARNPPETQSGDTTIPGNTEEIVCFLRDVTCASPWRRSRLTDSTVQNIHLKIHASVLRGERIKFSIPFGGYKKWSVKSAPLPDWAEIFSLSYLVRFARRITSAWPPGAELCFTYSSGVMGRVSNMPADWQEQYILAFKRILQYFDGCSTRIRLLDISTLYESRAMLDQELAENFSRIRHHWDSVLSQRDQLRKIQSAERNLVLNGIEDLRNLSRSEYRDRVRYSAMMCDALDSLSLRRGFNKYGEHIQLVFVRGPSLSLHIGSCESSAFHFWAGTGYLERAKRGIVPRISSEVALEQRLRSARHASAVPAPHFLDELELASLQTCLYIPD